MNAITAGVTVPTMTTLKDIMTTDLTTLDSTATLREVAHEMKRDDIGNVLIMDGETLLGIVTDRDIVVRAVAEGRDGKSPVADIITRDVFTMPTQTDVKDAAKAMAEKQLRRLPVTDGGKVVGIISLADLATRTESNADQKALEGISKPN